MKLMDVELLYADSFRLLDMLEATHDLLQKNGWDPFAGVGSADNKLPIWFALHKSAVNGDEWYDLAPALQSLMLTAMAESDSQVYGSISSWEMAHENASLETVLDLFTVACEILASIVFGEYVCRETPTSRNDKIKYQNELVSSQSVR